MSHHPELEALFDRAREIDCVWTEAGGRAVVILSDRAFTAIKARHNGLFKDFTTLPIAPEDKPAVHLMTRADFDKVVEIDPGVLDFFASATA